MEFSRLLLLVSLGTFVLADASYDYVVIGGGTGGLTVASRLAENKSVSVLVIEAGPNAENLQEVFVPGLIGTGQSFTTLNWAYQTIPQENLGNRQLTVNAGKALGGSTIINSMIFSRGAKEQYDAWGKLNGDSSWTWDALLPFFKKSETFTPPNKFQLSNGASFVRAVHGFSGQVKVGFPNFFFEQSNQWSEASRHLGFPASPDLTNGNPHAVGVAPNSLDPANNTRCSAACAYYTPFADEPNFTVLTNATATRILWAKTTAQSPIRAVGVEYVRNGETLTVSVAKQVILSAGTIGSPKVLELSGVGNATIISRAGIPTVLEHPTVGENLADHVHSWANAFSTLGLTKDVLALNTTFAAEQLAQWFHNRTGLFSAAPRSLGIAAPSDVFNSSQLAALIASAEANLTQFASKFSGGNPTLAKGIASQHRIALDLYKHDKELPLELNFEPGYSGPTPFASRPKRNFNSINSVLYAPLSRGRTHIASSDPNAPPLVDPAYWSHPLDIAAQVAGIKLARRMLKESPLGNSNAGEFEPGAEKVEDEQIEEWLRSVVASDNHETGSMSMLPKELGGVVDTSLRVYGTANVRVVDASIIPFPISTHISSSVYMIGEKAAEIIINEKA